MRFSSTKSALLLAAPVISETVHGVVVYSRHGDRTSKVNKGYQVTNLGAQQLYSSGTFYRARYIEAGAPQQIVNISSDLYKPSQIWASGPDQAVLLQTATNFLQGLYPPLEQVNSTLARETLANGTETTDPLNGYQYIQIHSEDDKEPDTIWLKGSDMCPAFSNATATYEQSREYLDLLNGTKDFYAQFNEPLSGILPPSKISYANAYDVFDLLNVASIHNSSTIITPVQLNQLRYYANAWELGRNYNRTMPARSLGGASLGGAFLKQLNETVTSKGALKFSLMTGSYNTFLAFFGLANLTTLGSTNNFTGLPNYASSIVFELFSESDSRAFPSTNDLNVRFLFRNGTNSVDELTTYPLFGGDRLSLPYSDFTTLMAGRAIMSPKQWCSECQQTAGFCSQKEYAAPSIRGDAVATKAGSSDFGLTITQAGIVGAMTTLGVIAILGAAFWLIVRRKRGNTPELERKSSKDGASSTEVPV